MNRYLKKPIVSDLKKKMVFLGGPRQVGKTTLALDIAPKKFRYLNWDILKDRELILKQVFPLEKFIVYDEIHKFIQWRNYVKGLYDKHKDTKKILIYRKCSIRLLSPFRRFFAGEISLLSSPPFNCKRT